MPLPVSAPERWYMAFWLGAGAIALAPIYLFLFLIWRGGRR